MGVFGVLGHALTAGLAGAGEGLYQGTQNEIKEADERTKEAARLKEIQATADAQLMKEKAIEQFRIDKANEPLNRASAIAKQKLSESVPVTAAPVDEIGRESAHAIGIPDGFAGNLAEMRDRYTSMLDDPKATEEQKNNVKDVLAQLDKQAGAQQKIAQAAVTETRPRTAREATQAALQDLKINDPAAYESYSKALKAQQMHLGTGGMLVDTDSGEILVQNHTAEHIAQVKADAQERMAQKKLDATAAIEDKRIAAKQEVNQAKINAAASAKVVDPKAVESAIHMIGSYAAKPLGTRERATPFGQAVLQGIESKYPGYSEMRYGEMDKSIKAFSTGKQGDSVRSFNVAIDHANTANSLIDAMNNKDTQTLNKVGNFFGKQFGKDATTNYMAVKDIVADEIAKAVIGGQTAQGDREKLAHNLDEAKSPEQLRGVIMQWKSLMRGQLDGLRDQYERTTGHDDFDEHFLSKAAREAIHNSSPAAQPGTQKTTVPNPFEVPAKPGSKDPFNDGWSGFKVH